MVAFDILKQRGSDEPDAEMTRRVSRVAHENGPILLSCVTASTIRIRVPPTASDEIVDEGPAIPEKCLAA